MRLCPELECFIFLISYFNQIFDLYSDAGRHNSWNKNWEAILMCRGPDRLWAGWWWRQHWEMHSMSGLDLQTWSVAELLTPRLFRLRDRGRTALPQWMLPFPKSCRVRLRISLFCSSVCTLPPLSLLFICLAVLVLVAAHRIFIASCRIFLCSAQDPEHSGFSSRACWPSSCGTGWVSLCMPWRELGPQPGFELKAPAFKARVSHWAPGKLPTLLFHCYFQTSSPSMVPPPVLNVPPFTFTCPKTHHRPWIVFHYQQKLKCS